jgi:hypothetical protein
LNNNHRNPKILSAQPINLEYLVCNFCDKHWQYPIIPDNNEFKDDSFIETDDMWHFIVDKYADMHYGWYVCLSDSCREQASYSDHTYRTQFNELKKHTEGRIICNNKMHSLRSGIFHGMYGDGQMYVFIDRDDNIDTRKCITPIELYNALTW